MNIYFREMKANRKSFLFWCLGILAMIGGGMGKYSGFDTSGQSLNGLLDKFPKIFLAIFGMNDLDLSTASGFYAVIYLYLLIMAAIYSAMLGAGILAKEERDKTSEFLFVKPASRVRIISFKMLAALTYSLLFSAVSLAVSLGIAIKVAPDAENLTRDILNLSLAMIIIQLIFLFMGSGFAAVIKNPAKSAGAATSVILVTYLLSILVDISEDLKFLKYLTPFKYFEARSLINGGSFEPVFLVVSGLLILCFIGMTYIFFPKRDLYI